MMTSVDGQAAASAVEGAAKRAWWHSLLVWTAACWAAGLVLAREGDVPLIAWLSVATIALAAAWGATAWIFHRRAGRDANRVAADNTPAAPSVGRAAREMGREEKQRLGTSRVELAGRVHAAFESFVRMVDRNPALADNVEFRFHTEPREPTRDEARLSLGAQYDEEAFQRGEYVILGLADQTPGGDRRFTIDVYPRPQRLAPAWYRPDEIAYEELYHVVLWTLDDARPQLAGRMRQRLREPARGAGLSVDEYFAKMMAAVEAGYQPAIDAFPDWIVVQSRRFLKEPDSISNEDLRRIREARRRARGAIVETTAPAEREAARHVPRPTAGAPQPTGAPAGAAWWFVMAAAGLAVTATAGAWWELRITNPSAMVGDALLSDEPPRLVAVEATVAREPRHRIETPGAMGRFDYRGPMTTAWVWVDHITTGAEGLTAAAAEGKAEAEAGGSEEIERLEVGRAALLVAISEYDDRLHVGDRVHLRGWLSGFQPPANPGERDFRRIMAERGVVGRLTVGSRANVRIIETVVEQQQAGAGLRVRARALLERTRGATERALRHGLPVSLAEPATGDAGQARPADIEALGLLEALLLGERGGDMEELEEVFARTGLTHLLAISGLHLGILVAGTWWLVMVLTGRPAVAVGAAVAVVVAYVLMVPPRVPVLRAAVMTLAAVAAIGCGRRISAMATMSLAALLLLIWRPWDLFTAGFQLSFGVVVGLVLYARSTATFMLGTETLQRWGSDRLTLRRYGIEYVAVSFVAWCVAMPLIAWHFGRVSPLAVLSAVAMLPFVAGLLWLGYLKIVVTAIAPALGAWLGGLLWWLAELTVAGVRWTAALPGATWEVGTVSGWWVIATLAVITAGLAGTFAGRPRALTAAAVLLAAWLAAAPTGAPAVGTWPGKLAGRGVEGVKLDMFAVGHGTAILLRSGNDAWMYDCGSTDYLDITTAVLGPGIEALGVRRVDTVVLSHPDIDHFSGLIELVDQFDVRRVVVTEPFVADTEKGRGSAARFLLHELAAREVDIEVAAAGWTDRLGEAEVRAIWPGAGARFERENDGSLVVRLTIGERRVLLPGDIESEAMRRMLEAGVDVAADVAEFPHHGAWTEAAPDWLDAVAPKVLLQSTNERRLRADRWEGRLDGIERHITARHGAIHVHVDGEGRIHRRRFLDEVETR